VVQLLDSRGDSLVRNITNDDGKPMSGAGISYVVTDTLGTSRTLRDTFTTGFDGVFQLCDKSVHVGVAITVRVKRDNNPPVDALNISSTDKVTLMRILAGASP